MASETEEALSGVISQPSTEGIYWPTDPTGSFYWKHGAAYLNPNVIPEGQEFSNSIVENALQNVSEEVRQDILTKGVFSPPRMTPQDQASNKYGISWNPADLGPDTSSPEIYKAERGLPESFRPEGVDPYRSLTQRALDLGLGLINPPRFGQQASTAINPNVIPSNVDPLFLPPIREPMTGREAIEKYGPLTSSTARADGSIPQPGDTDWRGYTAEDVPLKDIRGGTLDFLNPFRYLENIANIPGMETIGRNLAGAGAAAVSAPVLAGIAGVGSALYPTRMGDAYIGEPVTSNVPLRDGTVRAGDTTFADQVAAERYGVQRYGAGRDFINQQYAEEPDYNVQDQMAQWYERAFIDPDEYGWTRPTIEQRQEAIRGVQDAPEGFWGALQDRIANLIPAAEASISRDVERQQQAPAPISREQEIENMMMEDRAEQLRFHPSSPLYEAPFEEGTGPGVVSPEQPIAQAVAQALANTDQPVQQNLQALVELAQTDPSIADRYVPGSQALQEITSQVDSFSEPTIEWTPPPKKKPKPKKTSKPKKAEVTPTVNIADLMREANRQRSAEMNKQLEAQRRKDLGFGWGDMWT